VVQTANWDYYESVMRFQRILDAHGISEALKEVGAKEGDLVMIGELTATSYCFLILNYQSTYLFIGVLRSII
jgi:Obg family GTPase CgtA-like protein